MKKVLISLGGIIVLAVVWYLASPLFFSTVVDEQLPLPVSGLTDRERLRIEDRESLTPEEVEFSGMFKDADNFHRGSGTATIYVLSDGKRILRFENFTVTNGPALSVYLVRSANGNVDSGFLDLGKLKGNKGNQNYEIPAGTDLNLYGSVVIWCVPFGVTFSIASLR